jgi:hypothetical protein
VVTLIVKLPPELEGRLNRAAEAEGVAEDELVLRTLEYRLIDDRRQAALEMLQRWREEAVTTDGAEIEERRRSWEAFKAGLRRTCTRSTAT